MKTQTIYSPHNHPWRPFFGIRLCTSTLALLCLLCATPFGFAASGLVAAYPFDAGTGITATDASGNGNIGAIGTAAWTTSGKYGSALSFDGIGAFVSVSHSSSLDLESGMTLEAWVYPTQVGGWRDIIYKARDIYYLEGSSTFGSAPAMGGTFSSGEVLGTGPLPLDTWSHLAATYDGAVLRFFVDGTEVNSRPQTGNILTSTDELSIGGDAIFGQFWVGLIDEVRIYNRALSETEIQADLATPLTPEPNPGISGPDVACPLHSGIFSGPPGADEYLWSIVGEGTLLAPLNQRTVTAEAGTRCNKDCILTLRTITDGVTSTFTKTVTVQDTTPPVIDCPEKRFIPCGVDWVFELPEAHDNCDDQTIPVEVVGTETNRTHCGFEAVRTWHATDACGNTSECIQTVTVAGTSAPDSLEITTTQTGGDPGVCAKATFELCAPQLPLECGLNYRWYQCGVLIAEGPEANCIEVSAEDLACPIRVVVGNLCGETTATLEPLEPKLRLIKEASPLVVQPGEPVTYTYTAINEGCIPLIDIVVVDDYGTPDDTGDDVVVCELAELLGGESQQCTLTVTLPELPCLQVDCGECEGKVTNLTLQYNGGASAQVTVKQKNGSTVFNATVGPGEQFSFSGTDNGTFGTEITIDVNGSEHTDIHTSCSKPIGPGLVAGDFVVVGGSSKDGGAFCPPGMFEPVPCSNCVTNVAVASALVKPCPGVACQRPLQKLVATDTSIVCHEVEIPCDECAGKVASLTLQYRGMIVDAQIRVEQKNGDAVFIGTVQPGDAFSFSGTDSGTFGTEITIFVNGVENADIHTSCSQPIGPGLVRGDFKVIIGTSLRGGQLCPVPEPPCDCEGKVTQLTLNYFGGAAAQIQVVQKNGATVFSRTVQPGENFTFNGTDSGTLGTEITMRVNGVEHAKIHTSCSKPIGPGLVAGSFIVVTGFSRDAGELCPRDPPEPNCGCGETVLAGDTTPPQLLGCPTDLIVECNALPDPRTVTATDNCDRNPLVTFEETQSGELCQQTLIMVRRWTATDSCGNTSRCEQKITLVDTTPPSLSCPLDRIFECGYEPQFGEATATDNCDSHPRITHQDVTDAGNCPGETIIIRTWTGTDACGNIARCEQRITLRDTTLPQITCPANLAIDCGGSTAPDDTGRPEVSDNCDPNPNVTYTDLLEAGTCEAGSTLTRTWVATDACHNAASCVQKITLLDKTPPQITCPPNIDVQCDVLEEDYPHATATDNCDPEPIITVRVKTRTPGRCANEGILLCEWTATDRCGNKSTCHQTVRIVDRTPPLIDCPPDITLECGQPEPDHADATATDNCDPNPTIRFSKQRIPGDCENTSVLVCRWEATDACGNVAHCEQSIIIMDRTPPTFPSCPVNLTVECGPLPQPPTLTATDNCDPNPHVRLGEERRDGDCPQSYTLVRTWTATDSCGNVAQCQQSIRVRDTTPPVLAGCPDNVTVECDALPNPARVSATDNCDPNPTVGLNEEREEGVCPRSFTLVLTWTGTDACGNLTSCKQRITVLDRTAPTLNCPQDRLIPCGQRWTFQRPQARDNCDGQNVPVEAVSTETNATACGFVVERIWRATDSCGNQADCKETVDVTEAVPPDDLNITVTQSSGTPGVCAGATFRLCVKQLPLECDLNYQWYRCDELIAEGETAHCIEVSAEDRACPIRVVVSNICGESTRTLQPLEARLRLVKEAHPPMVEPGQAVTYTYDVINEGCLPLVEVLVVDDNGTPDFSADDIEVGTVARLLRGESTQFTRTLLLPQVLCSDKTGERTGVIVSQVLPNGNILATFIQSASVNDNTYGQNAMGWGGPNKHSFNNLRGSDKAEFEFRNGAGQVVLRFQMDYIEDALPGFPSGFGTGGVTDGEGKMVVGSASSVLFVSTSLSENLNQQPFLNQLSKYTQDSPAPNDPNFPLWETRMIYRAEIDGTVFGPSGFGAVTITDQHNSPQKNESFEPVPCGQCVTNVAVATAFAEPCPVGSCSSDDPREVLSRDQSIVCQAGPCGTCEGKVSSLTLQYAGMIANAQIRVEQKNGASVFNGTLQPGDAFSFSGTDSGTFGTEITVYVNGAEDAQIHTSCSQPIGPGLVRGDFKVLMGTSLRGGDLCPLAEPPCDCEGKVRQLTLKYNGNSSAQIRVVQKNGDTVFTDTVPPAGSFTFNGTDSGTFGTEIKIWVDGAEQTQIHTSCSRPIGPGLISGSFEVVSGFSLRGGELCPLDPPQPSCDCKGKVSQLSLLYNGNTSALIHVIQKNGDSAFIGTVVPGETFTFTGTDSGTFGTEIKIRVNGVEQTDIHTSCSKPIGPGLLRGDFLVVAGFSREGGALCPIPNPFQMIVGASMRSKPMEFVWESKAGVTYQIEYCKTLTELAWQIVATVTGEDGTTSWQDLDTTRTGLAMGFYRVLRLP